MRVVIVVPRRSDGGQRDRLWDLCRSRWETQFPDWPIYEGHHTEGLFNRAAAVNTAARLADEDAPWDVALVIDGDVFLATRHVKAAVVMAASTGKVTWAHQQWKGLSQGATRRILADPVAVFGPGGLAGADLDDDALAPMLEKTNVISWSCCIAIRHDAWDTLNGFDERFHGWGWEDMAFQASACGLVGHERITDGSVYHLWHPRIPGSGRASRDHGGLTEDAVRGARLGRRYMVALRRDYGITDRPEPSTPEAITHDIANLKNDDLKFSLDAERLGMPNWDGWWPTLEELRDGSLPGVSIALVVHSGGAPETWEARRGYLAVALASLTERLRFERFERRVIYSDWGPERRAELDELAAEHGFYVMGPNRRLGYTRSMAAMWAYIARHVKADFVFQAEDDFTIDRPVDLTAMATVLAYHSSLVQIALLRGPVWPSESEPGTVLGHPRDEFEQVDNRAGDSWLEHRRFFTVNPMLMRRSLATTQRWPTTQHSEAVYGRQLFSDGAARSALWGQGEAWITHLGEVRAGGPY